MGAEYRIVCWECGLREAATIHGADTWWQHTYTPAVLVPLEGP
jgi:hypothetical protein